MGKIIAGQATAMLSLWSALIQKEKAVKTLTSGTTANPYRPSSLRAKMPLKASESAKDNKEINKILEEANKIHENYLNEMANCCVRIAKEELKVRIKKLHHKLFDSIKIIA